jgi:hypothetical protein
LEEDGLKPICGFYYLSDLIEDKLKSSFNLYPKAYRLSLKQSIVADFLLLVFSKVTMISLCAAKVIIILWTECSKVVLIKNCISAFP